MIFSSRKIIDTGVECMNVRTESTAEGVTPRRSISARTYQISSQAHPPVCAVEGLERASCPWPPKDRGRGRRASLHWWPTGAPPGPVSPCSGCQQVSSCTTETDVCGLRGLLLLGHMITRGAGSLLHGEPLHGMLPIAAQPHEGERHGPLLEGPFGCGTLGWLPIDFLFFFLGGGFVFSHCPARP